MIFLFFLIDYVNHNTSIFGTLANLLYKIRDRYQNIVLVEAGDEEPHSKHLLKYCIITSPIPSFSVLLDDPDSLITFGISKLYEGKFSFYNNLVKRNISVVISDNYSVKYRIDPVSNRDSSISLNNTEYSFIYNLITKYSVFSSNNPSICKNKKKFPEFFIHVILLFTFITILSFFSNTIFKIPITNTNFWLWKKGMQALEFQKDCNEIDKKIINETLQKSIQTNKDCSTLMKISRKENTIDFHIVSCFILSNGNRFLFTYIDTPTTSPSEMKNHLDVKFSSNTTSTIGDPIFEFVSYRDIIPAQIHFKFSYNSSGTVMIPEDILVTLSKRGESIANFLVIKEKVGKLMAKNSFCHQNFEEAFHEMCLLTGASCAFCYENDILDYSFYKNDISHLSADILNSIPLLIKNEMISYIEPNLVPGFDLCFVICDYDQWRNKKCVIVYPNSMSIEMFTRTGVPIAAKFCLFLYDISRAKQLHLKFHNFLELLACTNHFAFIEFTRDLKNILCFKMSSDISINNEILDSKDVQYFLNSKHFSNEEDYEFMINYYKSEEYKESFISQKIIEVTSYPFHWTSNCLSSVFDINLGKHVVSLLVEDISDITNKDQKYLAEMNDIEQASKILDLHKFIIKENGVFLLDNKIFEKLHVDPNDRSLKNILSDSDQKKIEYLKYPSKFTISLIDSSKNLLWYSAMSNGYFGFLYCVNEFIEQRKESQKKQNSRAYSHKICMWSVNQNSDKVLKLFDFPSIWDLLTVDANKKFIHFADFVRPDKRNLLLNKYHDIVSLNIDSWTIKVPLIQIGGSYKWYRIHFTRAKNNRIYCIAHDINEIKIKDDRKKILLSHKNHLLKDFNVMIWTFEDTYDKYNIKNTLFEPGITAYLRMNWWFANKYIDKAELEIFREKMQKAIKSSLYFECIVTLNFDKSYHVLLQGKSGSVISGFCINIDNIWHENDQMKQKVDLIRKQNMKRTKKKSLMKECNTLSKLSCIYGGLDLLSAKSFNSWQEWIIELFRYMSNKITGDTYCYIYSPSSFNILDTIEHLMHIMHFYCDEKKIELEVRIDGLFPERIYEKKEPLNFLLFSFVNNFLNYTPEYSKLLIHFKWIISIPNNCEFFKIKISSDQKIKIPELSLACIEMKPVIDQSNSKLSLQLNGISYPYKRIKSKPKYVICCNDDPINRQIIQQFEDYGTAYTLISKNNLNTFLSTMEHVKAFFVDDIDAKHMIEQRYIHPCIYYICEPIYQSHEPLHIYKPVVSAQIRKLLCSIKGSSGIINVFKPSIHLESIVRYVLLVEMNVDEQYILAKMLESIQCSFYIARNGDESISALEKFKFDIIFMDCDLPFSEGLSLTKMIRLLPKRYSCIPIIGISADISIEQESLLVGMNAFYPKPIRIHSIKDALTRFSH